MTELGASPSPMRARASVRLHVEVARRSFRRASTYRLATASGVFVNTVFGYLRASVLVFVAVSSGGVVRGLSAEELATYAFVSQGMIMIVGLFGDPELGDRIRSGDVVVDLYRPADLQTWWLATWLGKSAFQVAARGIPPVLLGAIAFDLVWPSEWWIWPAFVASIAVASVIGFGLRFWSAVVVFWLLDNRGVDQAMTFTITFFAGMLLPLQLFPGWLETIARWLPFASLVQLPVELYLGQHDPTSALLTICQQVVWAVVVLALGRRLLAAATRKVVIQGG